ncbi:MAG: M50 family metallopeptidase [Planctomycetota bacterium]|nr:M50 family metallopeptidase [Planctomycetota bacterium]
MSSIDKRATAKLILILICVVLFWNSIFLYPLKVLVVMFHEFSHGFAAILTGGSIVEIQLSPHQGGFCVTMGGNRFLTLTAGYLGSLLCGGFILVMAARTDLDEIISWVLGIFMVVMALLYVRPFMSFGFIFVCVTGAAMIAAGEFLSERVNDLILKTIGLTSCAYAILDIKSDVLDRPELRSDAVMLAREIGGHSVVWGVIWIVVGLVASAWFLKIAAAGEIKASDE